MHSPTPEAAESTPDCDIFETFCLQGTFLLTRPIAAQHNDRIDPAYRFGSTMQGLRPAHHGVEFENPTGTPVLAAYTGKVVFAGDDSAEAFSPWLNFYGRLVIIEHAIVTSNPPLLYTLYAHLSKSEVSVGDQVAAGQKIGEVGMSGSASGSHLHFEVRTDKANYDSVLNPELYLLPRQEAGEIRGGLAIRLASRSLQPPRVDFNIQYFPDPNAPAVVSYPLATYEEQTLSGRTEWLENAALGDLPAGDYRITFLLEGRLFERRVQVSPLSITLAAFEVP